MFRTILTVASLVGAAAFAPVSHRASSSGEQHYETITMNMQSIINHHYMLPISSLNFSSVSKWVTYLKL
jgi:hypothetical protein